MKSEAMRYFTDTHLTILGLAIFLLFFLGVLVWVFRKNTNTHYQHMSHLPLKDESNGK